MKQLIKAARVYKAEIPTDVAALAEHLATREFKDLQLAETMSVGFVPVLDGGHTGLVAEFTGGLAFRVRIDQKIIPASVVQRAVDKRCDEIEKITGRRPGKKEKKELKGEVLHTLATVAFPRTAALTCFYHPETRHLIVPSTSSRLGDLITTTLIHAVGSVKTETIHVSNVKHGLTARMKRWVEDGDDDAFGRFQPAEAAVLQQEKRRVTVKMGSLDAAHAGIREALGNGFGVAQLGLVLDGGTQFVLTEDFNFKSIEFTNPDEADAEATVDRLLQFQAEAALEVAALNQVVTVLCDMLSYDQQQADAAKTAEGEAEETQE